MRRPLGFPDGHPGGRKFGAGGFPPTNRRADRRENHEQSCRRERISDFPSRRVRPRSAGTKSHTMFWQPNCRPPWRAKRLAFRRKMSCRSVKSCWPQEFEHRLINGLQLIVSLLSLQSRTATTPEAARPVDDRRSSRVRARTCSSPAASSRPAGPGRVQAISPASVRGPFRPAVPGGKRLRHRGRGDECRNPDDAWRFRWASSSTS